MECLDSMVDLSKYHLIVWVSESDNEEDEFFDCDDEFFDAEEAPGKVAKLNKPVGRLRKNGRLRLIKNGEPMYIPVTQVSATFSFLTNLIRASSPSSINVVPIFYRRIQDLSLKMLLRNSQKF
jgi:hypothetical protein